DPLGDYRTGLQRLASVPGVRQVVPGHGHLGDAADLRRRLALDTAYLDAVSAGQPYDDPRLTADTPQWMRSPHEDQVRYFERLASQVQSERAGEPPDATGNSSTDGCAASRPMSYWVGTRSAVVASTCPLPGLRAKRGNAPPATWTLTRCPRPNRCAV